jgi:hypothetical protein
LNRQTFHCPTAGNAFIQWGVPLLVERFTLGICFVLYKGAQALEKIYNGYWHKDGFRRVFPTIC